LILGSSGANRLTTVLSRQVKEAEHESKTELNFETTPCLYIITTGESKTVAMRKTDHQHADAKGDAWK
jgi:hypothetical protein